MRVLAGNKAALTLHFPVEGVMKKTMMFFVLASGALTLGGCASWPSDPRYVEVVDQQKIQLVERWARGNNTQVIWVTTPTRRVPALGS